MPESYTGNEGDEALAAGLDVMDGGEAADDLDLAINKTRDYVVWALNQAKAYADTLFASISLSWASITGKPTHFASRSDIVTRPPGTPGTVEQALNDTFTLASGKVSKSGDTITGNLYLPNSYPADIGTWSVAYINGDGRVARGASSARFKDDITPIDPVSLGDLFPQLHTYVMKSDPARMTRVGYIAEHLAANPATEPYVAYERVVETDDEGNVTGSHLDRDENGAPIPAAIDDIALLRAQVAQLHERVKKLEATP